MYTEGLPLRPVLRQNVKRIFITAFVTKPSAPLQRVTVEGSVSFADYAHSFSQMVANAKASGDEIAALQMRQMKMEFEMGGS